MATARELMDAFQARIALNPLKAGELGAVYKFVLAGEDGGVFVLDLASQPGVREGEGAAECVLRMSASDFVKMVQGRSDPKVLFFTGKLKVEGEISVAMKLTQFTRMFA